MLTQNFLEKLTFKTIGCAIEVHKQLGPGLLESVYQSCMIRELQFQGIQATAKPYVPVNYKNEFLGGKLQIDILVENELVLELKAVEVMIPLYKAQLITYLKLSQKQKGLLINFNSEVVSSQIFNIVLPSFFDLPKE